METIEFNCNLHNAPAYSCSKSGDNTGFYVKYEEAANVALKMDDLSEKYRELERAVNGIIAAHKISHVDWNGMRTAERIINGDGKEEKRR